MYFDKKTVIKKYKYDFEFFLGINTNGSFHGISRWQKTKYQMSAKVLSFQFEKIKTQVVLFSFQIETTTKNVDWQLVFKIRFLVNSWFNEKNISFNILPGTIWISNQIMQNWIEVTLMGSSWVGIGNSYHKCVIIFILIVVIVIIVVIIVVVIVIIGSVYNIDDNLSTDLKLS